MGIGGMLGRRVAATEGGYFANRSREAITSLRKKQQQHQHQENTNTDTVSQDNDSKADVLPEILKNSIPIPAAAENESADSGLTPLNKFSQYNNVEPERPVSISPRTWALAKEPVYVHPSTANEMRTDRPGVTGEQAKLIVEGYLMIVKAFLAATAVVFGGAVLTAKWIKTSLEIQTLDDIPIRGREFLQPKVEGLRQMLEPVRARVHGHRSHGLQGSEAPSGTSTEAVEQGMQVKH